MKTSKARNAAGRELEVTVDEIDTGEEIRTLRREWIFERAGFMAVATILIGALVGLLGPGPLSRGSAGTPGSPLHVEYNRLERYSAPAELRIRLESPSGEAGEARLAISRGFIERVEIDRIDPRPASEKVSADAITYVFEASTLAGGAEITLRFKPNSFGTIPVEMSAGGARLAFDIFCFP